MDLSAHIAGFSRRNVEVLSLLDSGAGVEVLLGDDTLPDGLGTSGTERDSRASSRFPNESIFSETSSASAFTALTRLRMAEFLLAPGLAVEVIGVRKSAAHNNSVLVSMLTQLMYSSNCSS